jgi:hypothetical protein
MEQTTARNPKDSTPLFERLFGLAKQRVMSASVSEADIRQGGRISADDPERTLRKRQDFACSASKSKG